MASAEGGRGPGAEKSRALDLVVPERGLLPSLSLVLRRLGRRGGGLVLGGLRGLAVLLGVLALVGAWVGLADAVRGLGSLLRLLREGHLFDAFSVSLGAVWAPSRELLGLATLFTTALGALVGGITQGVVLAGGGQLLLRVGVTDALLPARPSGGEGPELEAGRVTLLTLHGRPGVAVQVTWDPRGLLVGEEIELRARLVGREGDYLPSELEAFRGAGGELLVRRPWCRESGAHSGPLELGLFLPLLALPEELRASPLEARVEVLALREGQSSSRLEIPLRVHPEDPALGGLLEDPVPLALPEGSFRLLGEGEGERASCSVCGDLLERGEASGGEGGPDGEEETLASCEVLPVVHCDRCGARLHPECWDFVGRCATFACTGSPRPGPPPDELVPASGAAGPGGGLALRAEVLRSTDPPDLGLLPESSAALVATPVPRAPRSWQEFRPLALAKAALGMTAPVFLLLGAGLLGGPGAAGGLALLVLVGCLVIPGSLRSLARLPASWAGHHLARAFPQPGCRDFSPHLRLLQAEAFPRPRPEGGGLEVRGKLLVVGLRGHRLDLVARVRTGGGTYLAAAVEEARGIYGELRGRLLTAPLSRDQARALRFEILLPGDLVPAEEPGALPPLPGAEPRGGDPGEAPSRTRVGLRDVALELLVACEGELLSEADLATRWQALASGERPATPSSPLVRSQEIAPEDPACPLCGEEIAGARGRCARCRRQVHRICWDFVGVCPGCGFADQL